MTCPKCKGRGKWVAFGVLPAMPAKLFLLNQVCGLCRGAGRTTTRKANEWKARQVLLAAVAEGKGNHAQTDQGKPGSGVPEVR